jgi:citrate lyase subunit beta / citryl-CoA lyase
VRRLADARRSIAAHATARQAGRSVVVVDGRLVEALQVAEAEHQVALAKAIARRGG